jgi:hypothetical protein
MKIIEQIENYLNEGFKFGLREFVKIDGISYTITSRMAASGKNYYELAFPFRMKKDPILMDEDRLLSKISQYTENGKWIKIKE